MRNHVMNQEVDKTLYQRNATFFIKNAFFILASVLLNFSMNRAGNDAYVLLNACLSTITLTYCLHLLHLCSCLGLTLSMSYDLFSIFIFFFILINHIFSLEQAHLFFAHFLEYALPVLGDNVVEKRKKSSFSESSASGCCLALV